MLSSDLNRQQWRQRCEASSHWPLATKIEEELEQLSSLSQTDVKSKTPTVSRIHYIHVFWLLHLQSHCNDWRISGWLRAQISSTKVFSYRNVIMFSVGKLTILSAQALKLNIPYSLLSSETIRNRTHALRHREKSKGPDSILNNWVGPSIWRLLACKIYYERASL